MPSPIGHALAGAAIALSAQPVVQKSGLRFRAVLVTSMCLAALPDADLLYQPIHRAVTHSVGSTILITILAVAVTGWVTRSRGAALTLGLVCGVAWGSHAVLDWLGADPTPPRGVRALWPFSNRWFISELDLFRGTERRELLTWASFFYNVKAIAQEVAILAPITFVVHRARSRGRQGNRAGRPAGGAGGTVGS